MCCMHAAMHADRTLNVVTKNLAVAFSTTLSETLRTTKEHITTRILPKGEYTHFATFSTSRHVEFVL